MEQNLKKGAFDIYKKIEDYKISKPLISSKLYPELTPTQALNKFRAKYDQKGVFSEEEIDDIVEILTDIGKGILKDLDVYQVGAERRRKLKMLMKLWENDDPALNQVLEGKK